MNLLRLKKMKLLVKIELLVIEVSAKSILFLIDLLHRAYGSLVDRAFKLRLKLVKPIQ